MKKIISLLFATAALYGCQQDIVEQPIENTATTRAAATLPTPIIASDASTLVGTPPVYPYNAYFFQTSSSGQGTTEFYVTNYDSSAVYEWSVDGHSLLDVLVNGSRIYDHGYLNLWTWQQPNLPQPYLTLPGEFQIKCRIHKGGNVSDWGTVLVYMGYSWPY